MSDEEREDTLDQTADGDTLDEAQTNGTDEKPSLIFGKYKDMVEAEKGLKELERQFHSVTSENATLKEKSELKQVLDKVAEISASRSDNKSEDTAMEQYNRAVAEIAEDFREDPEAGVRKLTQLNNSWLAGMEDKLSKSAEAKFSALEQKLIGMQERLGDMNPDYLERKELVDSLVADGMPKAKAIEWAKKMEPKDSRVLPTSMNGTIKRGAEIKGAYLTKEDRARMKAEDGLTDDELDAMEAGFKTRASQGGRLI